MTFKEIYDRVIPLWGDKISISDGMIMQPNRKYKTLRKETDAGDYFYSPAFSNQYTSLEESLAKDDPYGELMVWTMYQIFQKYARRKFEQGVYSFSPAEVDKAEIEQQYFKNLKEDGWEEQLANYTRTTE
jgi:hypothetical protein